MPVVGLWTEETPCESSFVWRAYTARQPGTRPGTKDPGQQLLPSQSISATIPYDTHRDWNGGDEPPA